MGDINRPSKKRAAGVQLSRDNTGLNDENAPEQELGTFKRASDEVLAGRKFFKARRQHNSAMGPAIPSVNPFAGIRLVTPTIPTATSLTNSSDVPCEKDESDDDEAEVTSKESGNNAVEVLTECEEKKDVKKLTIEVNQVNETCTDQHTGEATENTGESNPTNGKEVADNAEETTEHSQDNGGSYASFSSFQQLSNNQNAFSGLASSAFSSSAFSFGLVQNGEPDSQSNLPSIGFGTSSNGSKSVGPAFTPMQDVPKETGEENEETVFSADSALFEFVDGGWKERGKGEVKVNVVKDDKRKARFVMRTKGNLRLILNASLYQDMKLTKMDKKGITFPCVNTGIEGKDGLSTFALKFKDMSVLEDFCHVVSVHMGESATVLETPENSSKILEN